jgi:hypothetical protein
LFLPKDRNAVPNHLGIVAFKRNALACGGLVDLKAVAAIGEDWGRKRTRPRAEDRHVFAIAPQVARAIATADTSC